jgi:hypothetical protein
MAVAMTSPERRAAPRVVLGKICYVNFGENNGGIVVLDLAGLWPSLLSPETCPLWGGGICRGHSARLSSLMGDTP